jgi:phospholipid/cholesterol/gamma-HCH transport system substrate-binding protein
MMTLKSRLELIVGIFIVIGLVILVSFVFLIKDFRIAKPGYRFNIAFGFVNGVKTGAPVRLAGVDVGEVKAIDVSYDPGSKKAKVNVAVWVKKGVGIPSDSRVWINTLGLLGEKYIEIFPGKNSDPIVKEGDTITGKDPMAMEEVTEETRRLVLKVEEAVSGLNEVLAVVKTGEGTLGKLVYDKAVYQNIEGATKDLKELTEDLKRHPWKLLSRPKEKPKK